MEIRSALPAERDEVLDLLARWYDNREFFARYNQNDPAFRDELCLVARDAGRIVSSVQIFDRKVNLDGQAVPMGGIGSVYTLEEYRKRGVASALMRLSVETMAREGFEVSLLFAERLKFYSGFGWKSVTRTFTLLQGLERIPKNAEFTIEPFDQVRELDEIAAIYDAYSGRFNSTAIRDRTYWRGNLLYAGNPGEYFVVARAGDGRIAAYARAIHLYGIAMIMEFGYRPGASDAMLALFRHLGESGAKLPEPYAHDRRAQVMRHLQELLPVTHTAHDPELEQRLTAAGCAVNHHPDNNYMWRPSAWVGGSICRPPRPPTKRSGWSRIPVRSTGRRIASEHELFADVAVR
jgi:predicted N-acetyltransferase YhbS